MRKQFPQNIRAVVQKAILSFRDGQIGRTEINALLKKHFSDSQFDNILLCVQGDLERCKKINLENWKKKADKQVEDMAEKAKIKARKERDKKKEKAIKKVNEIIAAKSKASKAERKEQRKIERRANLLAKEVVNNKDMTPEQKMESMTALKKQVNDLVAQIYGKSGRESMAEITSQVDFLSDNSGQSIRVVTQPGLKNFSDMSVTPKEVELLRNTFSLPDRFKYDMIMELVANHEERQPEPEVPEVEKPVTVKPPKKHHHHHKPHHHHHHHKTECKAPPVNLTINMPEDGKSQPEVIQGPAPPAPQVIKIEQPAAPAPVSYTHLTLPTIYSV